MDVFSTFIPLAANLSNLKMENSSLTRTLFSVKIFRFPKLTSLFPTQIYSKNRNLILKPQTTRQELFLNYALLTI
jgi:hypothetical protein